MIWLVLVIAFIALVVYLWWKSVVIPSVTVSTDKTDYSPGEAVTLSGAYTGTDVSGKTVNIIISPPSGDDYVLTPATTDISGNYTTTWSVPASPVGGTYTVSVSCSGATAQTTFKISR